MAPARIGCLVLVATVFCSAVLSDAQTTCPQIPKCRAGRCTINGNSAVCTQCQSTYQLQNGGRACVCPPGKYDNGQGVCAGCPFGNYCKGVGASYVSKIGEAAADRGVFTACDAAGQDVSSSGLTTKIRATSHTACVLKPGYVLSSTTGQSITASTQTATVCPANTYNTGGGRQRTCTPCPSGLNITGTSASDHSTSGKCKVPPGNYIDNGVVKPCEKGYYRVGISTPALATSCVSCGEGITTTSTGSAARTECTTVLPGYKADWDPLGFAYNGQPCPYGTYWSGGIISEASECTSCNGYTTKSTKSTSKADCAAPPGYYKPTGNGATLQLCPSTATANSDAYKILASADDYMAYGTFGTYRAGWATTPNGVKDCKVCGANMESAGNVENEHPEAAEPALVAGSPDACFIKPGQSLATDVKLNALISLYSAVDCPLNTYGAPATPPTTGLKTTYCMSCSRGFITKFTKSTSSADCINPAGFGVLGKTARQCAPGSWAAEGSNMPCQPCAAGRNTTTVYATEQVKATDCFVIDGYGIFDQEGATAAAQWYDNAALPDTDAAKVALEVAECPVGRYSDSENAHSDIAARCVSCPTGSETIGTGSTTAEHCTVCISGYGRTAGAYGTCAQCGRGTFSTGGAVDPLTGDDRTDWQCIACGDKTFQYEGYEELISASTTMKIGSTAAAQCVPENAQLDNSVGTSLMSGYIADGTSGVTKETASNLAACVAQCAATPACHFAEWRYGADSDGYAPGCFLFAPQSGALSIYYKLPPTFEIAASAASVVRAQSVASGLYAKYSYDGNLQLPFAAESLTTLATARGAASQCNMMSNCWGFVETANAGEAKFVLKTGNDLVNVRTLINSRKVGEEQLDSTIIVQL